MFFHFIYDLRVFNSIFNVRTSNWLSKLRPFIIVFIKYFMKLVKYFMKELFSGISRKPDMSQ